MPTNPYGRGRQKVCEIPRARIHPKRQVENEKAAFSNHAQKFRSLRAPPSPSSAMLLGQNLTRSGRPEKLGPFGFTVKKSLRAQPPTKPAVRLYASPSSNPPQVRQRQKKGSIPAPKSLLFPLPPGNTSSVQKTAPPCRIKREQNTNAVKSPDC